MSISRKYELILPIMKSKNLLMQTSHNNDNKLSHFLVLRDQQKACARLYMQ